MTKEEFLAHFARIEEKLFAFALKLTRDETEARDLLQETTMRAYEHRNRFRPGTHFKSWVATILRNAFINRYRKKKTRRQVSLPLENCQHRNTGGTTRNGALTNLMMEELEALLSCIGKKYSQPFKLYFSGFSYQEIGLKMNLPIGTVKSRIHYARAKMQRLIRNYYGSPHIRRA